MSRRRERIGYVLLFPYTDRGMMATAVLAAIGGSLLALGRIRHEPWLWWAGLGLCVPFIYWFVTAFGVLLPAIWMADWRQRRAGRVATEGRPDGASGNSQG
jgi:hypothetical protein